MADAWAQPLPSVVDQHLKQLKQRSEAYKALIQLGHHPVLPYVLRSLEADPNLRKQVKSTIANWLRSQALPVPMDWRVVLGENPAPTGQTSKRGFRLYWRMGPKSLGSPVLYYDSTSGFCPVKVPVPLVLDAPPGTSWTDFM